MHIYKAELSEKLAHTHTDRCTEKFPTGQGQFGVNGLTLGKWKRLHCKKSLVDIEKYSKWDSV